jgi:hypothetical protein
MLPACIKHSATYTTALPSISSEIIVFDGACEDTVMFLYRRRKRETLYDYARDDEVMRGDARDEEMTERRKAVSRV